MEFSHFITEDLLYLIPVLWIMGAIIRQIPKIQNWVIPFVLLIVGIALSCAVSGLNPEAIIQGILITGAAVLGDQLIKQAHKA